MPKRFDDYDRVAVATGSDSGIGEAIAVALANEGFDVGVTWHSDEAGARDTAEKARDKARAAGRKGEVRRLDAGRGGRISNITSVHDHAPRVGTAAYFATKAGLGLLTTVMAQELAADGVTVNAVASGEIATPMTGNEDVDPHRVHRLGVPVGRPGDADEVAAIVG